MRVLISAALLALSGCDAVKLYSNLPKDENVLFWTQDQRDTAFRQMEKLAPTHAIEAGNNVHTFGKGAPLKIGMDVDAYMKSQRAAGLIIIHDHNIRLEKYGLGYDSAGRWTSFSVAKSLTSTMVGAAVRDGYIKSLDDKVTAYIPDLKGSAYDDVTVRQLLTMSSGLETAPFSPDPAGKSSQMMFGPDIAKTALSFGAAGTPGAQFTYANVNSQLAGIVLQRATGKRYADWLSTRLWQPIGAGDATVWLDRPQGTAHFFCCLQATARDWSRVGQLILDKGKAGGRQIVPAAWMAEMAEPSALNPNYGLQLWRGSPYVAERRYSAASPLVGRAAKPYLRDDVLFLDGAVAQRVYVVPSERLVIVRIGKSSFSWDDSELPNRVLAGIVAKP